MNPETNKEIASNKKVGKDNQVMKREYVFNVSENTAKDVLTAELGIFHSQATAGNRVPLTLLSLKGLKQLKVAGHTDSIIYQKEHFK